jgi:hypothetical protein
MRPCTDGSDGRYIVDFVVTRAGRYSLTLLVDGLPIRNSALPLLVIPAHISATHSFVEGEGARRVIEVSRSARARVPAHCEGCMVKSRRAVGTVGADAGNAGAL